MGPYCRIQVARGFAIAMLLKDFSSTTWVGPNCNAGGLWLELRSLGLNSTSPHMGEEGKMCVCSGE